MSSESRSRTGLNHRSWRILVVVTVVVAVVAVCNWWKTRSPSAGDELAGATLVVPEISTDGGYVGSSSCKECHENQHASWFESYHRTMTQRASPESVLAPFPQERLEFEGQSYRLEQGDGKFFVSTAAPGQHQRREIVMTTGSHHIQVYWVLDPASKLLVEFPFYYHLASQRWILRDDTMLHPPGQPQHPSVWNDRCIKCHSVNGAPGLDSGMRTYSTRVAELGIACEACHGPGATHVAKYKDAAAQNSVVADASIVNPRHLNSHSASQVCGRCHSATQPIDNERFLQSGLAYRPGDDLYEFVTLNDFDPRRMRPMSQAAGSLFVEDYSIDGYWKDGTCRVGGDEFNALIQSPCYQRGELSCLSCHSMHQSEPNDQLAVDARDNQACTQCHMDARFNEQLATHTHHQADSSGSQCYNCHMPHVTYALLTAMRSHRVGSPSVDESVEFEKPNACNLCHLDRTLDWTSQHLADWHGAPKPELNEDQTHIAASVLWSLKGNAATRIITAWHFGWAPALEASGDDWQPVHLAPLLDDPYTAIRFVADRSLRRFPGYESLDYDFLGPPEERRRVADAVAAAWLPHRDLTHRDALLLNADGSLRAGEVVRLLQLRDNRPISIAE